MFKVHVVTGWSGIGGSTEILINLTNTLNKAGIFATMYGSQPYFLGKCKSAMMNLFTFDKNDVLIFHFCKPAIKLKPKKIILALHEKALFQISNMEQFWDVCVFSNQKHRDYHCGYRGAFEIIPNLKENFKPTDKTGLEKVAGIIGSVDANKQQHVSIERALKEGMEKIFIFGSISDKDYFDNKVYPLLDGEKVIYVGYENNKQKIYSQIGCVFHSSLSECASLVVDECFSTNTKFYGLPSCTHEVSKLSNKEIINKWIKLIND